MQDETSEGVAKHKDFDRYNNNHLTCRIRTRLDIDLGSVLNTEVGYPE